MLIKDKKGIERFSVSQRLYDYAMKIKRRINNDDSEYWMVFYGKTGCGKSVRAQQFGYLIDDTLEDKGASDRVCFDKEEFIKAVIGAKKGQVVVGDEGISLFFNRSAMTKEGRLISELIDQIRQKNLCIILCIPNPLNLDGNVVEKINAGVHVWEGREGNLTMKGNCEFFINTEMTRAWEKLMKLLKAVKANPAMRVHLPSPDFREKGSSMNKKAWYPVGEKVYKEKKGSILDKYIKPQEKNEEVLTPRQVKQALQRDLSIQLLLERGVGLKEIQSRIGVEYNHIVDIRRKTKNFEIRKQKLTVLGGNIHNLGGGAKIEDDEEDPISIEEDDTSILKAEARTH